MLYWNTVNNQLKASLMLLMTAPEFQDFRLVGGTALSLYLGHRMSIDIDLFTDATYGSQDFDAIESYLQKTFNYATGSFGESPGMGKSYLIGNDEHNVVKLDVYYSMDPFFQPSVIQDGVRMASIEEIIAMKVDIIQRIGRKKDFWDLHELLSQYKINEMMDLHQQRFEWTHDRALIKRNFTDFSSADLEPDPLCLLNKEWIFIMEDIVNAIYQSEPFTYK